jgi:spermidine/putrescine transport system ATP-binding protein
MIDGKDMAGRAAQRAADEHGVPELRDLPAYVGGGERGFGLRKDPRSKAEKAKAVAEALEMVGLKGFGAARRMRCRAASGSAWRWPAR